jgi:hypothetical protein
MIAGITSQLLSQLQTKASSGISDIYSSFFGGSSAAAGSSATAKTSSSSTAGQPITDQLQALLIQLQSGGTAAPSSAPATGQLASVTATGTTSAPSAPGTVAHHHHTSGGGGSTDQDLNALAQDIASDLEGGSSAASGSTTSSSSTSQGGLQGLTSTFASDLAQALKGYSATAKIA